MVKYEMISENNESTVACEYEVEYGKSTAYQSEQDLENELIEQLKGMNYEYLNIKNEDALIANLRERIEQLNNIKLTDGEWKRLFGDIIASRNMGIVEKTVLMQKKDCHVVNITLDSGQTKNIYLIDKGNIHKNSLQVINQYVAPSEGVENPAARHNRYDVTILVNGLPLVHIELKRRGVDIKEAFNQINRYQRDSFWSGCGLFEYVQVFVISNGTQTKYYSNTTRWQHIGQQKNSNPKRKQTSNSYEFTSWWSDTDNQPLTDLRDFATTFFARHTILNLLTKYCVLDSDNNLLVMRPYQIAATEKILQRINMAHNNKLHGKREAGGYIWHTTGSGKTLTSFKTAQIVSGLEYIDKVLFVVDRKDLDYQTMKEYDRFEQGAANGNTNTSILKRQLEDNSCHIIITTIQKLSIFIKKNKDHAVFGKEVVLIFDECHRSQFGDMHKEIVKRFKKYYIFGFTGTPIFAANMQTVKNPNMATTEQVFGDRLHSYNIVNAINDRNVLPFRVAYIRTMHENNNIDENAQVWGIAKEEALMSDERIKNVVAYIIEHFNEQTKRNDKSYDFRRIQNVTEIAKAKIRGSVEEKKDKVRLTGFNSIFAVSSIPAAKLYYNEFKRQMENLPEMKRLKIACIYSFGANDAVPEDYDGIDDENPESTTELDQTSRDFLDGVIKDYNEMFGTSYDTSTEKFQNYYKELSLRMKNREIDLLLVVNMFLTGFDATTLNTLWVDKNLRMHGLLQAYSRTNRILNSIKTFGNIVCFRNLENATNESLAVFGDKNAQGVVLLRPFEDYFKGYEETDKNGEKYHVKGYEDLVTELLNNYPLPNQPVSEAKQKEFVKLLTKILRLRNILTSFEGFAEKDLLNERSIQDYNSWYNTYYEKYRKREKHDSENINDDLVFEMELVKQQEINIDYILMLVKKYHDSMMQDKEILVDIERAIDSSPDMRNKKKLIMSFVESINGDSDIDTDWQIYVNRQKLEELNAIITEEKLKPEETIEFVREAFRKGYVQETGTELTKILPPMPLFSKNKENARKGKIESVVDKLKSFFQKFYDICNGVFDFDNSKEINEN